MSKIDSLKKVWLFFLLPFQYKKKKFLNSSLTILHCVFQDHLGQYQSSVVLLYLCKSLEDQLLSDSRFVLYEDQNTSALLRWYSLLFH